MIIKWYSVRYRKYSWQGGSLPSQN